MDDRLSRLAPDELDAGQRALYDELTGGARAAGPQRFPLTDARGRLLGPFDVMLRNPPVGTALQALGARLRYAGGLTDRARELVILAVAAHYGSRFEADAHERVGAAAGLTQAQLADLRAGREPEVPDPYEAAALGAARALLQTSDLSDPEYDRYSAQLPAAQLFEVVCLVGYYGTLALAMRAFRADHPL